MGSEQEYLNLNAEQQQEEEKEEVEVDNDEVMAADSSSSSSSSDDDDSDMDDDLFDDSDDEFNTDNSSAPQEAYRVLNEADIRKCQENDIMNVSALLSVPTSHAALLLLHCNWNDNAVIEKWLSDQEKLLREVGLFTTPTVEPSHAKDNINCGLCGGTFLAEVLASASCGHLFCHTCWAGYIGNSFQYGMRCLRLKCPIPACCAAVTADMINALASEQDKFKYNRYFVLSYVEYNRKAKWCPAPYCPHAILRINRSCNYKITCNCLHSFCWTCKKEAHQPVNCLKVHNWLTESLLQSENWLIANNKKCPNCDLTMHISRRNQLTQCHFCNFQFCGLCLGSWIENSRWEGDHFTHVCSEEKLKEAERLEMDENRRLEATDAMAKFHNYHTQWKNLEIEQQLAVRATHTIQNQHILVKVAETYRLAPEEVSFIKEAWLQIVDCKRVLKWTIINDYYLAPNEMGKKPLLNYLQRQAQILLDRLAQCANNLNTFLNLGEPSDEFTQFRYHLCLETSVVRNYYENMLWAIEKGPLDMNTLRLLLSSKRAPRPNTMTHTTNDMTRRAVDERGLWYCAYCQFPNDTSASVCIMCYH